MSKMQLSFVEKVRLGNADAIILLRFKHKSGLDLYAYARANREAIEELQRKAESSSYVTISDYGEIILFGEGEPNDEAKRYIESLDI